MNSLFEDGGLEKLLLKTGYDKKAVKHYTKIIHSGSLLDPTIRKLKIDQWKNTHEALLFLESEEGLNFYKDFKPIDISKNEIVERVVHTLINIYDERKNSGFAPGNWAHNALLYDNLLKLTKKEHTTLNKNLIQAYVKREQEDAEREVLLSYKEVFNLIQKKTGNNQN